MSKEISFSELDSFLSKINDKGSIITKNTYSKIDEWISTGNSSAVLCLAEYQTQGPCALRVRAGLARRF
jgi:hypothetical protein